MTKAISLNEIRTRAAEFIAEWRDAEGGEREEQSQGRAFARFDGPTTLGLLESLVKPRWSATCQPQLTRYSRRGIDVPSAL